MNAANTLIRIPKDRSGVYLLRREGVVVYAGESLDVLSRLAGHKKKEFDSVEIIWCGKQRRLKLERELINKHLPEYNTHELSEAAMIERGEVDATAGMTDAEIDKHVQDVASGSFPIFSWSVNNEWLRRRVSKFLKQQEQNQ